MEILPSTSQKYSYQSALIGCIYSGSIHFYAGCQPTLTLHLLGKSMQPDIYGHVRILIKVLLPIKKIKIYSSVLTLNLQMEI